MRQAGIRCFANVRVAGADSADVAEAGRVVGQRECIHDGVSFFIGGIESIKAAEDGSGDLIVRLYESRGARGSSTITFDRPVGRVDITNLLEEPLQLGDEALDAVSVTPIDSVSVRVELRPFRILTLRVS